MRALLRALYETTFPYTHLELHPRHAPWAGVVKYHGPRPSPHANYVWVANHTSMIDYVVLCAYSPFAAIMQLHPGWVGAGPGGAGWGLVETGGRRSGLGGAQRVRTRTFSQCGACG